MREAQEFENDPEKEALRDSEEEDSVSSLPRSSNLSFMIEHSSNLRARHQQQLRQERENDGTGKMVPLHAIFSFADIFDFVLMFIGVLGSIGAGASTPLQSLVFGQLVDAFGKSASLGTMKQAVATVALRFVYIGCGTAVASFCATSAWMITGERQAARIRTLYLQAILRQDIQYFDREGGSGNAISGMTRNTLSIQKAISGKVLEMSSTFVAGFMIAFLITWKVSVVLTATLPVVAVVGWQMAVRVSRLAGAAEMAYSEAGKVVEQVLGTIRTVASYTGEKKAVDQYDTALEKAEKVDVRAGFVLGFGFGMVTFTGFGTIALAVWYSSTLVAAGDLAPGHVISAIFSVIIGGTGLGQLSPHVTALAAGRVAAFKMLKVIHTKPEIDSTDLRGLKYDMKGTIELRKVNFSYPSRPDIPVFLNFSLVIKAGTTVALVGESGSGKSTVINLIERFYDPQDGVVMIDGIDIKKMQIKWLRQQIALVSQEPVLFGTSIRDNIAYGKDGIATLEEIRSAASLANATQFVDRMPEGFDTLVGERGIQLSGGQKQRIAIARAILKNARILLLDEATSALDSESEHMVQAALDKVMVNRTTVVVAHRLSTIKNANMIAVVKEGTVLETGTHSELIQKGQSAYNQLVRLQETRQTTVRDNFSSFRSRSSQRLGADDDDEFRKPGRQGSSRRLGSRRLSSTRFSFVSEVISTISHSGSLHRYDDPQVHDDFLAGDLGATEGDVEEGAGKGISDAGDLERGCDGLAAKDVSVFRLASYNKPELAYIVLGSFASAVDGAILPFFGLFLAHVITDLFDPRPHNIRVHGAFWAVMYMLLAFVQLVANPIGAICFAVAGGRLIRRIRTLTFHKIVRQDIAWFDDDRNASAAVSSRLYSDAAALRGLVGDALQVIVRNLSTIAVGLTLAFTNGWQLAFVVLGLLPLLGMQGVVLLSSGEGYATIAKVKYENASRIAHDAISNIRTVASFCSEERVVKLFKETCKEPVRSGMKLAVVSGIGQGFASFTLFGGYAMGFWAGSRFVSLGIMTYGDVFKVFLSIALTAVSVAQTMSMAPDLSRAKASVGSVFAILDRDSKIDPASEAGTILATLKGRIEFEDVCFKYPSRPYLPVLQKTTFTLKAGQTLALVGESGSGKSTVISLLQRFYDPESGSVLIDGVEIRTLQLKWIRQRMGLVSQEPVLFDDTIRANILYGREDVEDVTDKEIEDAARAANAHNFIMNLPDGYGTRVGERGLQLSGGQKQRVAIARAIIKNPVILLLDEATSALDAESERIVQDALDKIMLKRTTIVVAHRLSTVTNCDQIAVMKSGLIVEQGRYDELLKKTGGIFRSLHHLQHSTPV